MTVDQFAEQVATEFGEHYSDPDVQDKFRLWVQEVSDDVYQAAPWFFRNRVSRVVLTAGTRIVEVSTDAVVKAIIIVSTTNPDTSMVGKPVDYVPVERLIRRPNTNILGDTGRPRYWWYDHEGDAVTTSRLGVYYIPDYDYTLDFYEIKHSPILSEDDSLPYPQDFYPALWHGMRSKVKVNDSDPQAAAYHDSKQMEYLKRLMATFAGPMGEPSRLQVKRAKAVHQSPVSAGAGA